MEYDEKVMNRMKRAEGQVKGVLKMMEEGKDCKDVISQLSAAKNALDRTSAVIVSKNLEQAVREDQENGGNTEDIINEAVQLLVKSR
ncbi:DNA-binding FrmR family transcriptional regulator [Virgibacillus natechei]|uniref:DNA-binding FrmR family transcriptional regulator n=1 Tax=Virgibacillus natechei TaxID=1216297 RepID=A0ABS4IHP1_9BACI|nr:metal-sensitive transcriptional regulator [Virgibacillus natechei]MBP1970469.1 DNA-binding FrmR family transcriptional regulator [Virgibacillus natechei]UZD13882.1 metal-sensitive transcriptional regulator [Virgibacillus natechei]